MIYNVNGDLLKSDCDIIGHQCNCLGGFGSGIAGQIRKTYPEAYISFSNDKRSPEDKLGDFSTATSRGIGIFNLYGQFSYGRDSSKLYTIYSALELALDKMICFIDKHAIKDTKIGLPFGIGCGLANGDWSIVYNIIERISDKYKRDIYLYRHKV